jgi:predicted DNA binding protein
VVPELHRLSDYDGGKRTLETLTDRQLEVLQTAYEIRVLRRTSGGDRC